MSLDNKEIKILINEIQENLVIAEAKNKKAEMLLDQLKEELIKENKEPEQYLTVNEVAELFRTSVQVIRNKTSKHLIPFVKIGRKVLYPANEINKMLLRETYGPDKVKSFL